VTIDRTKLLKLLDNLQLGGVGTGDMYRAYLDRLPDMFGSATRLGLKVA
jgi:hypothetical protein